MPADAHIYDRDRLANCYAHDRPPVHPVICARIFAALPLGYKIRFALDIGCGAGASAEAIATQARHVTGIDPFRGMLERARSRLPTSTFIQGIAEALPVQSASFELVTAAGSLNYTDTHAALAETSRVLAPDGYLAAYDFCTGRVLSTESREASCFQSFERTFPWPPEYPLDLEALPYREHGLTLVLLEHFLVELQMTANGYIRYIMSETNVEAAISNGTSEAAARDECWRTFGPLFARGPRTVGFRAVLALARKEAGAIDCDA